MPNKHPCPDCSFCQWCGDDRCSLCLRRTSGKRKLSLEEQIALYEAINTKKTEEHEACEGCDLRHAGEEGVPVGREGDQRVKG